MCLIERVWPNGLARGSEENLMAVFFCAPTQRPSDSSPSARWTQTAPLRVIVVVATLGLAGCNANRDINPSSQAPSQVFAGHYEDYNPYNPISYAQNNTGRGGGR
jgi:hypothetical protein